MPVEIEDQQHHVLAVDRRRPGRLEINPALVPVLRGEYRCELVGPVIESRRISAWPDWEFLRGAAILMVLIGAGLALRFIG